MEAIKGTDVNVPDAVFAWLLDGRGGVKPLEDNDVIDTQHPAGCILIILILKVRNGWRQRPYFPITCVMRWRVKARARVSAG